MVLNKFLLPRQKYFLASFLIFLLTSIILGVSIGSFDISIKNILRFNIDSLSKTILLTIRMPRVVLAAFVGASLAISGACLQGLFRNPLADPGLIGVSAGAALGASIVIVLGSSFIPDYIFGPFILPLSAIMGAALVIYLLYLFTKGFGYQGVTYMLSLIHI